MTVVNVFWRYTPLLILAAFWEAATRMGLVSEFALPPLSAVIAAFFSIAADDLGFHIGRSIVRGAAGFAGAVLVGVPLGILMAWYRPVRVLINPVMRCIYPMPKSALIPLTIMWIGLGDASKITLIFIGCMLPIVMSAYNAARGVDKVLLWSARSLGASESELLREIVIPASLPEILNGIRISLALSFILMVSAELLIANNGIGYLIDLLGSSGDYAGMFAAVITVAAVGFAADRVFMLLSNRLLSWRGD